MKEKISICLCCSNDIRDDNSICCNCKQALELAGNTIEGVMNLVRYLTKCKKQRPGKLNIEKAREIRSLYFNEDITQDVLAGMFGVTQAAIGRVVNNVTYKECKLGFGGEGECTFGYN